MPFNETLTNALYNIFDNTIADVELDLIECPKTDDSNVETDAGFYFLADDAAKATVGLSGFTTAFENELASDPDFAALLATATLRPSASPSLSPTCKIHSHWFSHC